LLNNQKEMSVWDGIKVTSKAVATPGSSSPILDPTRPTDELPAFLSTQFKLDRKIGKGAFGVALVVSEVTTNEKYVAKVMNLDKMSDKDKLHLKSEVACLALCNHPTIIAQKAVYTTDEHLVLIMELGDGGDLRKEIHTRKKRGVGFNNQEIACVFVQVCLALDHVHSKNILHRDVKPANVFFTKRGLVKLGDFGFSKQYEETLSNPVGQTVCGTPYYMSPEMWQDERYSRKSDLWSLGIVLYEMMMMERPFVGDNLKELSDAIRSGGLTPLPVAQFDDGLVQACYGLLRADVCNRMEIREVLVAKIFQDTLISIRDLLQHQYFSNIREGLTEHINSFLVPKP
jgi:serine/threonine protein kinase